MWKLWAGNVAHSTGEMRVGLEWIGDRHLSQAKASMKRREERMDKAAAEAADAKRFLNRSSAPRNETAPVGADAVTSTETDTYASHR